MDFSRTVPCFRLAAALNTCKSHSHHVLHSLEMQTAGTVAWNDWLWMTERSSAMRTTRTFTVWILMFYQPYILLLNDVLPTIRLGSNWVLTSVNRTNSTWILTPVNCTNGNWILTPINRSDSNWILTSVNRTNSNLMLTSVNRTNSNGF